MLYYTDEKIVIRDLKESDGPLFVAGEREQGWNATIDKYERRLRDQKDGICIALTAEYLGQVAGYVNVYPNSPWGAFANQGYPEIMDFGVLEKYRRNGIGKKLMDVAEEIAARYSDIVYLGVGLHSGYGSAQRMYIKRGYIPDGSGVWYRDQVCLPYTDCRNDDDLVLYLSKNLSAKNHRP